MNAIRSIIATAAFSALVIPAFAQTETLPAATPEEPGATMLGGVAAVVNDEVISISDVVERARLLLITLGVPASEENLQQALPRAMDELIDEHLQLQKAQEYELTISDEEVNANIQGIAQNNQTTIEGLLNNLREQGINPDTLKDQMRAEIAWRRIINGLYGQRVRISKNQIDGMLDRLKASALEERYQLSEIFLYAPSETDKQKVLQGANVIVQQLRQGARFQLAAQQYSNSPTAAVGGDLGWVSPAELEPQVQEALKDITPPALTSPIPVDDGVYIYAVRGKQAGFEGVREVELRQVSSPEGKLAPLNALMLEQSGCEGLSEAIAENPNLSYMELGRIAEASLSDEIKFAIEGVQKGGTSGVIDTPAGKAILFVCDRSQTSAELPSRSQIEDRLYGQQLALLGERELRDLKREATIIRR